MENVQGNKFFRNAKDRAAKILKNKDRLNHLLRVAQDKMQEANLKNIKTSALVDRIKVISRMIKAYVKGEYREVKVSNILLLTAAVVYFVTPVDLIPDFIPITGFVDDFSVIVWVYTKLQQEIDSYIAWENNHKFS